MMKNDSLNLIKFLLKKCNLGLKIKDNIKLHYVTETHRIFLFYHGPKVLLVPSNSNKETGKTFNKFFYQN